MTVEDHYVAGKPRIAADCRLVVISGCSGSGKSTLLDALARRGYDVVPEAGRQIVKEEMLIDGDGLPWRDDAKFARLLLSRSMYLYNSVLARSEVVFFDRSVVESFAYFEHAGAAIPAYVRNAVEAHRYWKTVFMTPPWKEVFANDPERPYRFEDVAAEYDVLLSAYRRCGYDTRELPLVAVEQRADLVERELGLA